MFRRVALALALVSALTGCASQHPKGPLVEYRDGQTSVTREVKCEATYVLHPIEQPAIPLAENHVLKGERIGFRCDEDGSVLAVGPGYTKALPRGAYSWDLVTGSTLSWYERVYRDARGPVENTWEATLSMVRATCIVGVSGGLLLMELKGGGGFNPFVAWWE